MQGPNKGDIITESQGRKGAEGVLYCPNPDSPRALMITFSIVSLVDNKILAEYLFKYYSLSMFCFCICLQQLTVSIDVILS